MVKESEEGEEIKFQDRRRIYQEPTGPEKQEGTGRPKESAAPKSGTGPSPGALPETTFAGFILSLSTQALMCLGEIPDPNEEKTGQDLKAAQQIIDILGLLKEKTKGNLDKQEVQLLEHVLYDLRLKYVQLASGK